VALPQTTFQKMGSGQINGGVSGGGGGGNSCCDMSMKCWCRWRLENQHYYNRFFSSGFVFFFACFVLFGSIASFYGWLSFSPSVHESLSPFGCHDDNEGSWSIGIFYGHSPFSLKPIEFVSFSLCFSSYCFFSVKVVIFKNIYKCF